MTKGASLRFLSYRDHSTTSCSRMWNSIKRLFFERKRRGHFVLSQKMSYSRIAGFTIDYFPSTFLAASLWKTQNRSQKSRRGHKSRKSHNSPVEPRRWTPWEFRHSLETEKIEIDRILQPLQSAAWKVRLTFWLRAIATRSVFYRDLRFIRLWFYGSPEILARVIRLAFFIWNSHNFHG